MNNIHTLNRFRWAGYERPTLKCVQCGKVFPVSPSEITRGRKYCSKRCDAIARKGRNVVENDFPALIESKGHVQ